MKEPVVGQVLPVWWSDTGARILEVRPYKGRYKFTHIVRVESRRSLGSRGWTEIAYNAESPTLIEDYA